MGTSKGRHRAARPHHRPGAVGIAGVAVAASALLGMAPALGNAPVVLAAAKAFWVPGTNIGGVPPDDVYAAFADDVIDDTAGPHDAATKVGYPAGFWPLSKGYFNDPTYNASVRTGLANLHTAADGQDGAIIYGYSQGAVVATLYKRETGPVGDTYVLVSNPNRPNGGILQRFNGVTVPILDVSFNGATPVDGDTTYDIARQYDGWSDFPRYPLNLLATANALLGIVYLHGKYHTDIDPAVLDDPEKTDTQVHGSTTYYLIHTDLLPLLMPLAGFVPEPILKALDAPLRVLVELGYDRSDYGNAVGAGLIPAINPVQVVSDLVDATGKSVGILRDAVSGTGSSAVTSEPSESQPAAGNADDDPGVVVARHARSQSASSDADDESADDIEDTSNTETVDNQQDSSASDDTDEPAADTAEEPSPAADETPSSVSVTATHTDDSDRTDHTDQTVDKPSDSGSTDAAS